jgi:predicted transcriptional regulator
VDEIIETVLRKQGQVVFVNDGSLEKHQRIALTLRY